MRFLADENLSGALIRGILHRNPNFDIVRVQDVGLRTRDDRTVLAWAAQNERILITRDIATMSAFAYERVAANLPMPGVLKIRRSVALNVVILDLLFIEEASNPEDWANKVAYLPL